MSQIIRYIWRKGETNPQSKGQLQSNVTITCGSSEVTGTLIWQGFLFANIWGTSTVTGTLSSYVSVEAESNGVATVTGTLTAVGDLEALTNGTATVTGTLLATGYMYVEVLGSSLVTGLLTSKKLTDGSTDGSTTVTGTLTNGTVYINKMIGITINEANLVGSQTGAINWNSASSGQWYFSDPPPLAIPQPTSYQSYTFNSTSAASPKIIGEPVTLSHLSIPLFGDIAFDPSQGHKFHYLISATEYSALQLTDILNNMIEIFGLVNDGTYYKGIFNWDVQQNGSDNYIYMIYDFRRNVSEMDVVTDGSATTQGTLIGHGELSGAINGLTTVIPDLTAINFLFGGVADKYPTKALFAPQLDAGNFQGSSVAYWNTTGMVRFERHYKNGPWKYSHELGIMVRLPKAMFYVDSFFADTRITYVLDIDGRCTLINQGVLRQASNLERMHFPGATHISSPSGYFTFLSLTKLKGHIIFPKLTGELYNMNHIFNNAVLVETLEMPLLTRIALQLASRSNFQNMNGLKRVYMPLCVTFVYATGGVPSIFGNIPAGTIMYLHPSLETSDGGLRHASVVYWEDTRGAVIRYVNEFTAPNTVNDLSASSVTETSFNLDFTVPSVTVNAIEYYEVWIYDDINRWRYFTSHQEIVTTGGTILGLESGTTYRVEIKTVDILFNKSSFSNQITVRTPGIRGEIVQRTSVVGVLQSV